MIVAMTPDPRLSRPIPAPPCFRVRVRGRASAGAPARAPAGAASLLALGLGVALAFAAGPASAQVHLRNCMEAKGASASLADSCRRALDAGGLSARQQAGAWVNMVE